MNLKNLNLTLLLSILIISLLVSLIFNSISPKGINFTQNNSENMEFNSGNTIKTGTLAKGKKIDLLTVGEAYKVFEENNALFIDSRDQWDYSEGHIFNSVNIPEFSFSPYLPIVRNLDKEGTYVGYCGSDDCDLSRRLAVKLKQHGFKKVLIFTGGWQEWVDSGYPIFRK